MGFRQEVVKGIIGGTKKVLVKVIEAGPKFPKFCLGVMGGLILVWSLGIVVICELLFRFCEALVKDRWEGLKFSSKLDERIVSPFLKWWIK